MVKQVQKRSSKKLKLYIISTIKKENKLPADVKKNVCDYHLKPFVKAGLVQKKAYGVWELTAKGTAFINLEEVQKKKLYTLPKSRKIKNSSSPKIRGHGYRWHLKLPARAFYSVEKRLKVCRLAKLGARKLNNGVIATNIMGNKVHLATRTINLWINKDVSYLGSSAKESHQEATFEFVKLISLIERYYGVSLKINKKYVFKPSFKHYGDLGNEIAKKYNRDGKFVRIYDKGKEWLIVDFSQDKFEELELTDNDRNIYDTDFVITPFMNTLRHEPDILNKMKRENEELKEMIYTLQKGLKHLMGKEIDGASFDSFKY